MPLLPVSLCSRQHSDLLKGREAKKKNQKRGEPGTHQITSGSGIFTLQEQVHEKCIILRCLQIYPWLGIYCEGMINTERLARKGEMKYLSPLWGTDLEEWTEMGDVHKAISDQIFNNSF